MATHAFEKAVRKPDGSELLWASGCVTIKPTHDKYEHFTHQLMATAYSHVHSASALCIILFCFIRCGDVFSQFKNETQYDTGKYLIVFFNIKSTLYLSETCPLICARVRGMNVLPLQFCFTSLTFAVTVKDAKQRWWITAGHAQGLRVPWSGVLRRPLFTVERCEEDAEGERDVMGTRRDCLKADEAFRGTTRVSGTEEGREWEQGPAEGIFSLLRRNVAVVSAPAGWGLSVSPSCAAQLSHTAVLHSVLLFWHTTPSTCLCAQLRIISMEMRLFMQCVPAWTSSRTLSCPSSPRWLTITYPRFVPSKPLHLFLCA